MEEILHTCKNCGNIFTGKYCNSCGQKVYTEKDKNLSHLAEELFHFVTHFEGTLFTTLKTIFTRPGQLSLDYCNGIRKKYFKPLSFFLLLVFLYLLFPLFTGLNMNMANYLRGEWYSNYANSQIRYLMTSKKVDFNFINEHFHYVSERISKFLLIIIIPLLALVCSVVMYKKKKPFFDHFVFATEMNSFLMLWGFLLLPVLVAIFFLICRLVNINFKVIDDVLGAIVLSVFIPYAFIAIKRFYGIGIFYSSIVTIILIIAEFAIVKYIYKFILFYITIHLVH